MAQSAIDQELQAIKTITDVLDPLDIPARQRALQYAIDHLGLRAGFATERTGDQQAPSPGMPPHIDPASKQQTAQGAGVIDIRSLCDQKRPGSDVEMAVIVAYYLSELVPEDARRETIRTADITTYFKQAGHPLPSEPRFALKNAKVAGYLESAGHGQYKLNPVGHNLVAHTLPRAEGDAAPRSSKKRKRKKKATKASERKSE